jgi:hypothetical protein
MTSLRKHIISLPSCIQYENDTEYRNHIRRIFRFDPNEKFTYNGKITKFSKLDSQTQDEIMFDSKQVTETMDEMYRDTSKEGHFQELYIHAAGRMFSTDPHIGHAIICSYDTFQWYYTCVWYFYVGGVSSLLMCSEYEKLKSYFNL